MEIAREAEDLMAGTQYEVASPVVLSLALESGCSAYDCEFVALARYLEIPLVMADLGIIQKFPETAYRLESYADA